MVYSTRSYFLLRDIARGDIKCLSSLLYLSTLDNKSENSKKFHSLLLIKCGKQRKLSTALYGLKSKYFIYLGLILCNEPYYNEGGNENQRGTVEGRENSRLYNEMVSIRAYLHGGGGPH